jgi:hypothetical protein
MKLFLDWYAEQYDAGAVNRMNYLECASYLEGLRDAMTRELSDEALQRLIRCETVLRGAANLTEVMRREKTPSPDNGSGKP